MHYGLMSYFELGRVYARDQLRVGFGRRSRKSLPQLLAPPVVVVPGFDPSLLARIKRRTIRRRGRRVAQRRGPLGLNLTGVSWAMPCHYLGRPDAGNTLNNRGEAGDKLSARVEDDSQRKQGVDDGSSRNKKPDEC